MIWLAAYIREFDAFKIEETVIPEVRNWLRDLGFAKRSDERMIAFVSEGGTCRCAMAKAITKKILQQHHLNFKLRVESCAKGDMTLVGASEEARQSIQKLFGEDLLAEHRTMRLTNEIIKEADLILVMDEGLGKGIIDGPKTREKASVFKPFFGLEGDILDPYKRKKGETKAERYDRYDKCAAELNEVIEQNIEKMISFLNKDETGNIMGL